MLTLQSQIHNSRKIMFVKTSQTRRIYVVYLNLPRSLRILKDTRKSIPRPLRTRNSRCEMSLRSKGEVKCHELPHLHLPGGQKQTGTNHPISDNQGNHIIRTCREDEDVSLFRVHDQARTGTESPPAGLSSHRTAGDSYFHHE